MTFIRPGRDNSSPAPTVLGSELVADNEDEGVDVRTLTFAGLSAAGLTFLAWVGLLTANFTGPVAANNGNTYALELTETFAPLYTQYSLRSYSVEEGLGGSDHTATVDKDQGAIQELTFAAIALSHGTIVDSVSVNRTANGAGASHVSGDVTVSGPALLVAVASGTGDPNVTAPTQTWPVGWTIHESVARNSSQDASGHVPLYLATKAVDAGTHNVTVQTTIDEGLIIQLFAVA